ncbi:MAG: hypothetical protein WBN18_09775, partial [Flavobacteriaceae bacterium]
VWFATMPTFFPSSIGRNSAVRSAPTMIVFGESTCICLIVGASGTASFGIGFPQVVWSKNHNKNVLLRPDRNTMY